MWESMKYEWLHFNNWVKITGQSKEKQASIIY